MSLLLAAQVHYEAARLLPKLTKACAKCGAHADELCRHAWSTPQEPNHKLAPCEGRV